MLKPSLPDRASRSAAFAPSAPSHLFFYPDPRLAACPRCGQVQHVPSLAPAECARCVRCRARLDTSATTASALPAALALAALILYPLAMSLPVLEVRKLGHVRGSTIWSGVVQLYADGHAIVGTVVLLCSIVIPLAKIAGIFVLSSPRLRDRFSRRHQSLAYSAIDWLGRWGMIDVLLVAILVAAVKLGDWIDVSAGPGIVAFAGVVVLSLLSSFTFDPRTIWASGSPFQREGAGGRVRDDQEAPAAQHAHN